MKKRAEISLNQTYAYPIEDVFRVIFDSIITQMKANGKKHNLNHKNPLGKTSDYIIVRGKKELPVHFEVTKFNRPYEFSYIMEYNNTKTEQEWRLAAYDDATTRVTYTERATTTSFLNNVLRFFNKKQFIRTATGYFERIHAVLEQTEPTKLHKQDKTSHAPTYNDMNVQHLRKIAKREKIKIPADAKKAQIIKLLKKQQNNNEQNKKAG